MLAIKHFWGSLPGPQWFSAADIYRDAVLEASDGSTFVEVGSWKGRSTCCMCVEIANSDKRINFFAVDTWQGSAGEYLHQIDRDFKAKTVFEAFERNISSVAQYVKPMRMKSVEAAGHFCDESIDFLYLDAGHYYSDVHADLVSWYPKVKSGGVICGDDWLWSDNTNSRFRLRNRGAKERFVMGAVEDYFGELEQEVLIVPGSAPNRAWSQWMVRKNAAKSIYPCHPDSRTLVAMDA